MNPKSKLIIYGLTPLLLAGGEDRVIIRSAPLRGGLFEGVRLDAAERVVLAADGDSAYRTCGVHTMELDVAPATRTVRVSLLDADVPQREASPHRPSSWPAAVCDIVVQTRFRGPDGPWSPWQPRNLLADGGFADGDGNGIPDGVTVMRLRTDGAVLALGAPGTIPPCPPGSWWHDKTILREGSMVAREDLPPGL